MWRAALVTEGDRIAAIPLAAFDAPVAACPGWDVARLITHLGRIHRWATAFLRGGESAAAEVARQPRPARTELPGWYRDSRDELVRALDELDPDAPADTFAGPGTVRFWLRRQAHETAMHRWDAQDAVSPGTAEPIDPRLAADGVDEWLTVFVPRFLGRGPGIPDDLSGYAVQFRCTDIDAPAWTLRLTPPLSVVEYGTAQSDSVVTGSACDLLLTAWHRAAPTPPAGAEAGQVRRVLDLVHVT